MKILIILVTFLSNNLLENTTINWVFFQANSLKRTENKAIDSNRLGNLRIRQFDLEIIPPSSGIQFYNDGIIFLSHSTVEEKVPQRHLSFGSIRTYSAQFKDTISGNLIPFDVVSSELFPSEATTFSSDFKTMYISLIPAKASSEKIFKAEHTTTGWKIQDKPLDICSESYIYSHPCLSEDGSFMIFSSDVPGSTGGLDMWITRKEGEKWGSPKNLGKKINSAGNELFASLDSHNNLYFSSDGHPGKGGYDIFIARYNGTGWDSPVILPETINTKNDELAYTINKKDDKTAFYTTRSRSGKSRTQLFIIDIKMGQLPGTGPSLSDNFLGLAGESISTDSSKVSVQFTSNPQNNKQTDNISEATPRETISTESKKDPTISSKGVTDATISEAEKKPVYTHKPVQPTIVSEVKTENIVYRVQITANTKPVGSQNITVAGKIYKSFEYLYQGGYRTTIGEYSTITEAMKLQSVCRQNGYGQAFVVAFKNNIRSNDPDLFKKAP